MGVRPLASISGSALAVLIGLTAQLPRSALAQQYGESLNDFGEVEANAKVCIDQSLPPEKRITACTAIIGRARHGSSSANTRISEIFVARATAFQQKGDDDATIRDFETAAKIDARSKLPWLGLANFYMEKSQYSRALENYDRAVEVARKDPEVYDDRGTAFAALKRNDAAIADFTHAITLDHENTNAYSNRATVYLASHRPELAIADLTEVIRAEPANGMAYYNRGAAYEISKDVAKAEEDYRSAARFLPSYAPAYEALGRILAKRDPNAALSELGNAIQLNPRSPALRTRAMLYLSLGQFEPALHDLDQVIANDGSDSVAYLDRGVAEERQGNLQDALGDYNRSIELATTTAGLVDRGSVYARLREPQKALADFDAALAIDPKDVPALIGRANANYAPRVRDAKRLAVSLDDYTSVIEADPQNAAAYFTRGNIHFDLREYAAAYSDYSESLKLDPTQPEALFNRSLAAEHLGRSADAASDRRLASKLNASVHAGGASNARSAASEATQTEHAEPRIITETILNQGVQGSAAVQPHIDAAAPK